MVKVITKKRIDENKNLLPSKTAHRSPSSTCVFELGQRYHLLSQCLDLSKHFLEEGEAATFYYLFLYYVITVVRKKVLGQKKYQGILSTLRKAEFMENSLLIWVNVPLSFKWLCNF